MDTSDIRKGLKIVVDGEPHTVIDFQFVKPGKGQAFTRCRLRNMAGGGIVERSFRSGEPLEPAVVEEMQLRCIQAKGGSLLFADAETGEPLCLGTDQVGSDSQWLSEGMTITIILFKGRPIGLTMPPNVVLQIVNSEPQIEGDTASGATKRATLSTGAIVQVPLFVQEGDWVKIDTTEGRYLERVNRG